MYQSLCPDNDFIDEAGRHFNQMTWQMRLTCLLLEQGFETEKAPSDGPDILIIHESKKVWVECVCPDVGTGPDKVVGPKYGQVWSVPDKGITLRVSSSIHSKMNEQFKNWKKKGIVDKNDYFIIALNSCNIPGSDLKDMYSHMDRVLYGVGDLALSIPHDKTKPVTSHWTRQSEIAKRSGSKVPMAIFEQEDNRDLSAVIYSSTSPFHNHDLIGNDLRICLVSISVKNADQSLSGCQAAPATEFCCNSYFQLSTIPVSSTWTFRDETII
jgi:hypothetical protein